MKRHTKKEWKKIELDVCMELKGKLTLEEYKEMIALEYILDQCYSDNPEKDTKRYIELSDKKYS